MTTSSVDVLSSAHEQARDELKRADTKATTLLSLIGASLAGVIALSRASMNTPAMVLLWCAAAPITGAVLVLLLAIKPRLGAASPGTWLHAAELGPEALLDDRDVTVHRYELAEHTCSLGSIAVKKFRRIRDAITLLTTGLGLLVIALIVGVTA